MEIINIFLKQYKFFTNIFFFGLVWDWRISLPYKFNNQTFFKTSFNANFLRKFSDSLPNRIHYSTGPHNVKGKISAGHRQTEKKVAIKKKKYLPAPILWPYFLSPYEEKLKSCMPAMILLLLVAIHWPIDIWAI